MKKILIIDDEQYILNILTWALKSLEAEIDTATSIEEAEEKIKTISFDLIISDIRLTGIYGPTGLELIPFIKEKSPNTEVIIITAYGSPIIEEEGYKKGAGYYFEKPFDLKLFVEVVEKIGFQKKVMRLN